MRFGVRIDNSWPRELLIRHARFVEDCGLDSIWINDNVLGRDAFMVAVQVANATKRVDVGVSVANPYLKHPSSIAGSAATLAEFSGGRAFVTIGSGNPNLTAKVGVMKFDPVTYCKEAIIVAKRLLSGKNITYNGRHFCLKDARLVVPPSKPPRILLGANGPKMLRMAGEVADGMVIRKGTSSFDRRCVESFQQGLGTRKVKASLVAYVNMMMNERRDRDIEKARAIIVDTLSHLSPHTLKSMGIDPKVWKRWMTTGKVPSRILSDLAIIGTAEDCAKRIRSMEKQGFNELVLHYPMGSRPTNKVLVEFENLIADFRREIIPKLG